MELKAWRRLGPANAAAPVVLSSPHSGRIYPDWFFATTKLTPRDLRPLDDGPTDLLLADAVAKGAVAICAVHPRAVVDLNRSVMEFDAGLLKRGARRRCLLTPKVRAGLGVVPSVVGGRRIHAKPLGEDDFDRRIERIHRPYHERLRRELDLALGTFGEALLLDVHSMPDLLACNGGRRVDVALGDRFGRACAQGVVARAKAALEADGLRVALNHPYAGGHLTERFGRPHAAQHALQVEFRRGLFMDEASGSVDPAGVGRLSRALAGVVDAASAVLSRVKVESAA